MNKTTWNRTPISTQFLGISFGVADCRLCAFRPLFCPLLRFFPVSYLSRSYVSIQMGLDTKEKIEKSEEVRAKSHIGQSATPNKMSEKLFEMGVSRKS
jgi:hypothetical protein